MDCLDIIDIILSFLNNKGILMCSSINKIFYRSCNNQYRRLLILNYDINIRKLFSSDKEAYIKCHKLTIIQIFCKNMHYIDSVQ